MRVTTYNWPAAWASTGVRGDIKDIHMPHVTHGSRLQQDNTLLAACTLLSAHMCSCTMPHLAGAAGHGKAAAVAIAPLDLVDKVIEGAAGNIGKDVVQVEDGGDVCAAHTAVSDISLPISICHLINAASADSL